MTIFAVDSLSMAILAGILFNSFENVSVVKPKIHPSFWLELQRIYLDKYEIYGSVAQWITRLTTNQEIEGSSPSRLEFFYRRYQNISNIKIIKY